MTRLTTAKTLKILVFSALAAAACETSRSPTEEAAASTQAALVGDDGAGNITAANTVVNRYASLAADLAAGATALTVTNVSQLNPLAAGDLLLVVQMQGATLAGTDDRNFGAVSNLNNAGRYELVQVQSISNNTLTLRSALRYAYTAAGTTQVIRVPQYQSLTVTAGASIVAPAWNGSTGGIVALHVADTANIGGAIDVSSRGFRGGAQTNNSAAEATDVTTWRTTNAAGGGQKGEGIGGFQATYDANINGRFSRGAPANGGGGGNSFNAGGGGGANGSSGAAWTGQGVMDGSVTGAASWALDPGYVANGNARTTSSGGGRGGYSYAANNGNAGTQGPGNINWGGNLRRERGGVGGRPLANDPAGRLFMGGGGGAGNGNSNNAGAGGAGGGLVLLFADTIAGAGQILANGGNGTNTPGAGNDGAGGAGAGGSIVLSARSLASGLTVTANGGTGGNNTRTDVGSNGPGGGGGGGFIAVAGGTPLQAVLGGAGGQSSSSGVSEFPSNGATRGAAGQAGVPATNLPITVNADLAVSITDGQASVTSGSTVTYTVTVSNNGPNRATHAPVTVTFPSEFSAITWTCTASSGGSCLAASGSGAPGASVTLPVNGSATLTVTGTLSASATGSVTVGAAASAALHMTDPTATNNSAQDTDTVTAPIVADLVPVISAAPDPVDEESTTTWALTVVNAGPSTASAVVATFTLPAGIDYLSASGSGWTCSRSAQVVTCTRPSLALGGAFISISTTATGQGGVVTASATVSSATTDNAPANNTATYGLTINGINDGPVQVVPVAQAVADVASLTFSAANGNALSVSDVDSGTSPLRVTLTVTSGTLTLGSLAGLTFVAGDGTADATMTFTGALAAVNAALQGLRFQPGANGSVTLTFSTNDQGATGAGGALSDADTVSITVVDTTPPDTGIAALDPNPTNDNTTDFAFTATEVGATFECRIGAAVFAACPTPYATPVLGDGAYTLEVRAVDATGNRDATPASITWTVDTAAPNTTLAPLDPDPTNDNTTDFTFASTEPGSTFECRLGSEAFAACTSPYATPVLADGTYTFEVRALDAAGNVDPTPAAHTWKLDTAAPDTTLTALDPNPTNDNTTDFTFASTEPGSTFQCRIGSAAFAPCSTPYATPVLADGTYTLEVRATDGAGNVDPSPATYTWSIDTASPNTTLTPLDPNPTNDNTTDFTFASTETSSTFECRIGAAAFAACTTPYATPVLADGTFILEVRAIDAAGNVDPTPTTYTWGIDATPPDTTLTALDANPTGDNTTDFTFVSTEPGSTLECRIGAASFAACTSPYATPVLADGTYTLEVRARDSVGNFDPTPASHTWTIDTAAPNTTLSPLDPNPTNDNTTDFTFASTEPSSTFECRIGSAAFATCTSPLATPALADGAYTLEVRAIDAAGNVDPTPATHTWTIDTAPPNTTVTALDPNPTNDNTTDFTFASTEPNSTFECRIGSATFAACTSPYATPVLADGAYTLEVRAIDAAGNVDPSPASYTWTIDATPPETTITPLDPNPTSDNTPDFTFSSNDSGATFECRLGSAAFAPCTSPYATPVLTDGAYSLEVRARDAVGNVDPTPASYGWSIDTAPPNTTLTPLDPNPTNDNTTDFTFASTEPGSTFECRLGSAAFAPCATPFATPLLADGTYTLEVRAIDAARNVDPTPASYTWAVDASPPETSLTALDPNPTNDSTTDFTFATSEPGATFECRLGSAPFAPCATPYATPALADGSYTLEVRALDAAGNADPTPASAAWTIDTQAPDTSLVAQFTSPTNSAIAPFTLSSTETGSTFECRVDGGAWAACRSPYSTEALDDGQHQLEVRATDRAGNTDPVPASFTWTIDAAPVETSITALDPNPTNDSTTDFSFRASKATATFECRLDGGAFAACTTPYATPPLPDGPHTLEVRARDTFGSVDSTPASNTWVIDTLAPDTTLVSLDGNPTNDNTTDFTFSSSESGSTFECRVDGGAWAPCTSPYATAALADGSHTLEVRATDRAGNTDTTPAARTWIVDNVEPDTTLVALDGALTNDATADFTLTAGEAGSTFECRVDGGAWSTCATPFATPTLTDGLHTLEVRATDPAGNTDPSPASHSWTLDTRPPDTALVALDPNPTNDTTPDFTFSATEGGSTFECRVDAGAWASCASPYATAALRDGAHTLEVRARDPAGNLDPTPASWTSVVDTAAPDTTLVALDGPLTSDTTADFTFASTETGAAFECSLDGSAWAACSPTYATPPLAGGPHTLEARAIDPAGNTDPSPASHTWTLDTTAPETTLVALSGALTRDATADFTFAASEAASTFECRVDGAAWVSCETPYSTPPLLDGPHVLEVRATDSVGNTDGTPARADWTLDTTPPDTSIAPLDPDPTADATTDFTLSAGEAGATFECRLDGGTWSSCSTPYATPVLADGRHTLEVRATDPAGNTTRSPASYSWTIDTRPPETSVVALDPDPTNDDTTDFQLVATKGGSTFACRIDGGSWSACTTPFATPVLADGPHALDVQATDALGNTDPTPATYAWTIDTRPPETTLTALDPNPTNDPTTDFTLASTEAGATFECRIDAGAWAGCASPYATPALPDGSHTLEVRSTDRAGNTDSTPVSYTWSVDGATLETSITPLDPNPTSDNTPEFTLAASKPGATFTCRLDAGAWLACSTPYATPVLADGPHTLEVRAADPAGNVDATPATYSWTIDTAAPRTLVTALDGTLTQDPTADFNLSSNEAAVTFECRLDDGAWSACASPYATPALPDGAHSLQVRATDDAGNTDPVTATHAWTLDTAAPETTLVALRGELTNDRTADFTFSSSEPGTFECRLDGGTWVSCQTPYATPELADGPHALEVRAVDRAANVDPTPARFAWTLDGGAIDTLLVALDGALTNDDTADFTFTASKTGATFECRLDASSWTSCTSPYATSSLEQGPHSFEVRARDAAGNVDEEPARADWVLDTSPPETSFASTEPAVSTSRLGSFAFIASEAGSTFECSLDDGAFVPCPSIWITAELGAGTHTLAVRATDPAGNTDPSPEEWTWRVDDLPLANPDLAETSENGAVDVDVVANDTGTSDAPLSVTIASNPANGRAMVNSDGTVTYTPRAGFSGTDAFSYTVTDRDGQSASATVTVSVRDLNDPPIARDDLARVEPDGVVVVSVLANDRDPEGGTLTVVAIGTPSSGAATLQADGTIRYVPANGFTGGDSFTYTIADPLGATATATVRIGIGDDSDGDGLTDAVEASIGTDPLNPDSDGDLIGDSVETNGGQPINRDDDATIDARDPDSDNDGVTDRDEGTRDTDGDGDGDWRDSDDDGDGIDTEREESDGVRFGNDVDGDGIPSRRDVDSDADTRFDEEEGTSDDDSDGIPNYLDPKDADGPNADPDGDGLITAVERVVGTDPYRADSDGDGLNDRLEDAATALDADRDGRIDALDRDSDDDEVLDEEEHGRDTDGDETPDFRDPDDDDDGIRTSIESRDARRFGSDNDADGLPAWRDLDSDGDGASDESEGTTDRDGDGVPNYLDPVDDGPDADPDGDRLVNSVEGSLGTNPYAADSDRDGLDDFVESDGGQRVDTDSDGLDDALDPDSDGDTVPDADEGATDTDRDGTADFRDPDDDGDSLSTEEEARFARALGDGRGDVNDDGTPAWRDPNADGDARTDAVEGSADDDSDGVSNFLDPDDGDAPNADPDGDGLSTRDEVNLGSDPYEADTDGDGLRDGEELGGDYANPRDTDGDGRIDIRDGDDDGDGILTRVETALAGGSPDPDGDGLPAWLDVDADGDTIPDAVEAVDLAAPVDTDLDETADLLDLDSDDDGLPDADEVGEDPRLPRDSDEDGLADYRDNDADNDDVPDGRDNCPFTPNPGQEDTGALGVGDACRNAPVLEAIDPITVREGETASFTARATDPDQDLVAYTVSELPNGARFDPDSGRFEWVTARGDAGSYVVRVGAVDRTGRTAETEARIEVVGISNRPPVIRAPASLVLEPEIEATLEFEVSDPDGDVVTCAARGVPENAMFSQESGRLVWTPSLEQDGVFEVTLDCTDGLETATATTRIEVLEYVYTRTGGGLASALGCTSGGDPASFAALAGVLLALVRRRRARGER
jgi:uncharacterized repeat protein (TIGR01451 family)